MTGAPSRDANGNIHRYSNWWENKLSVAQAVVIWSGRGKGAPYEAIADLQDLVKVAEEYLMTSQKICPEFFQ